MPPTTSPTNGSGVQALIDQIRDRGVRAAQEEAGRIVAEAKTQAAATRAKADAEAKSMVEAARAQIATERAAGAEAIRSAARDALLDLRSRVREAFEVHVRRLVSEQAEQSDFVRSLVLVLAGEAADQYINDHDAVIFVSSANADPGVSKPDDPAVDAKVVRAVLGATGVMLREGVSLRAADDFTGGARVRLVGEDLEIDMTDESLSRLLLKHLLPRYRAIVEDGPTT